MSLNLRSITNCNLKSIPWFSDNKREQYKAFIEHNIPKQANEDELVVLCVQEIYGYRSGPLGFISNYITSKIKTQPSFLQKILNITLFTKNNLLYNDLDIFSGLISIINRSIPILNVCSWDDKSLLLNKNNLKYMNNDSLPGMFDIQSLFCMSPIFDSGCGIISNKKPIYSGFEKFYIYECHSLSDHYANKGIVWNFYKSDDNLNGILIMTYNVSDNMDSMHKLLEVDQIINLKNSIETAHISCVNNFEIYIFGDLKINIEEQSNKNSYMELLKSFNVSNYTSTYYMFSKHSENKQEKYTITDPVDLNSSMACVYIDYESQTNEKIIIEERDIDDEMEEYIKQFEKEQMELNNDDICINIPIEFDTTENVLFSDDIKTKTISPSSESSLDSWTKI